MSTKSSDGVQGNETRTDFDVVVVGSGAAGMVAALTARSLGLSVVILEKSELFGGTTAMSGGGSWVPGAPALAREGAPDDRAAMSRYLDTIIGDRVSAARRERYLDAAPRMFEFLEASSPHLREQFVWVKGYSDYRPLEGGSPLGHGVWPKPIDRRMLGELEPKIRKSFARVAGLPQGMWLTPIDLHDIVGIRWRGSGLRPYGALARLLWRVVRHRVLGERISPNGGALIVRLRLALLDAGIPVLLETPMRDLTTDATGTVTGVNAEYQGRPIRFRAAAGVILATGGFEFGEMRSRFQPVIGNGWSHANPENKGDGHKAAMQLGAAMDLMEESWWYPSIKLPTGYFGMATERKLAGHIVVNGKGERFANEASDYNTFGRLLVEGHKTGTRHIPAHLIIDDRTWKHNIICGHFPGGNMPRAWIESGCVAEAASISELAEKIDVPVEALQRTVARFNNFARNGVDEDFGRGDSAYDNYNAQIGLKNPNLMPIGKPPYYAFQLYPGDLGTKGGVVTDSDARALRQDGSVISNLYAAGNVSSAVMGTSYAGPGSTLGPAMTFAWIAAHHAAAKHRRRSDAAEADPITAS